MDRGRRFREAVVVSQEPFRPNVRLICQVLTEMGLAVAVASSSPPAPDAPDAAPIEPSGGDHVRGTLLFFPSRFAAGCGPGLSGAKTFRRPAGGRS